MKVLGLDIGTRRVRAVEIETGFGARYEIQDYHEMKIGTDDSPLDVAAKLIAELPKAPDRIVVGIPNNRVTFRTLSIPVKDRKEAEAAIQFTLEDDVPFEPEDMLFDFTVLSRDGKVSTCHVEATLNKHLAALLADLDKHEIDPGFVTSQSWAYRTLLSNKNVNRELFDQPLLLIKMGEDWTDFHLFHKNAPVFNTHMPLGGNSITNAIAEKYELSFEEADHAKVEHGFILSDEQKPKADEDQLTFSAEMEKVFLPLVNQIKQSMLSTRTVTDQMIEKIVITGGPTLMPGLRHYLQEKLGVPVEYLRPMSQTTSTGLSFSEETEAGFGLAIALAMSTVRFEGITPINFRKGAFAKQGESISVDLTHLRAPAISVAVIAVLLIFSNFIHDSVYSKQVSALESNIRNEAKSILGSVDPTTLKKYIQKPSTLKRDVEVAIKKERDKAQLFTTNPHFPLNFIDRVSSVINKSIPVELKEMEIGSAKDAPYSEGDFGETRMKFIIETPSIAGRIRAKLAGVMDNIKVSDPTPTAPIDGEARYEVTISGKPKGSSYER